MTSPVRLKPAQGHKLLSLPYPGDCIVATMPFSLGTQYRSGPTLVSQLSELLEWSVPASPLGVTRPPWW